MYENTLQHTKIVYANYTMHQNSQKKVVNKFMAFIDICVRLKLGLYSPYICIYTNLEACTQSGAGVYIYIYIHTHTHLNLGAQG